MFILKVIEVEIDWFKERKKERKDILLRTLLSDLTKTGFSQTACLTERTHLQTLYEKLIASNPV